LKLVVLGLSLSSSWGNGHATTYRALLREFAARGHEVMFLERDVEWYRFNRDLEAPNWCRLEFYSDLEDLKARFWKELSECDWAIVGSYVPEGIAIGNWARYYAKRCAFYDIDTPVTLQKLARGECDYLSLELIERYNLYLSFSGGPTLDKLEEMGSPCARALYCSVDPALYFPTDVPRIIDLGYLGTYSDDRQPTLNQLLVEPAKQLVPMKFQVAGPQYPDEIRWPDNVNRIEHLPPREHNAFYNSCRYTLNVTRSDMIAAGWSPSVRLFEAAACGTPIISDAWAGLDEFFTPGKEIWIAPDSQTAISILRDIDEDTRQQTARAARARVLSHHTAAHRAFELEKLLSVE